MLADADKRCRFQRSAGPRAACVVRRLPGAVPVEEEGIPGPGTVEPAPIAGPRMTLGHLDEGAETFVLIQYRLQLLTHRSSMALQLLHPGEISALMPTLGRETRE